MILWRQSTDGMILRSILDGDIAAVAEEYDKNGVMANHVVCNRSNLPPFTAIAWKIFPDDTEWRPMSTWPEFARQHRGRLR
jgi:hypothetical protein